MNPKILELIFLNYNVFEYECGWDITVDNILRIWTESNIM